MTGQGREPEETTQEKGKGKAIINQYALTAAPWKRSANGRDTLTPGKDMDTNACTVRTGHEMLLLEC